jgi:hypothetical protein
VRVDTVPNLDVAAIAGSPPSGVTATGWPIEFGRLKRLSSAPGVRTLQSERSQAGLIEIC